jgi:uncharacterized membrane protein
MDNKSRFFAFFAFFTLWFGSLILIFLKKDDRFVSLYSKQGIILGLFWVLIKIVFRYTRSIAIISSILRWVTFFIFIFWLFGCIFALLGKEGGLPILRNIANKF